MKKAGKIILILVILLLIGGIICGGYFLYKNNEESNKKMEEDRKYAIENIPNVVEKGKSLIYPFRHEEWTKLLN